MKRTYSHRIHSMAALNKAAATRRQPWVHPTWARMQLDAIIASQQQKKEIINDRRK